VREQASSEAVEQEHDPCVLVCVLPHASVCQHEQPDITPMR